MGTVVDRGVEGGSSHTGLERLALALKNWSTSRKGERAGRPVGFPRFNKRGRGRPSVAFTTGAIRVCDDRRSVVLPRLGRIHVHESTRKLHRRIANRTATVKRATCTRDATRRWHVSFTVEVQRRVGPPAHVKRHHTAVGVDVGTVDLIVAATADGAEVLRVPAPRGLTGTQAKLRRLQRKAARQRNGSARQRRTRHAIARLHRRAADRRADAIHKATTALTQQFDTVVVETLGADNLGRRKPGAGKGGRGLNRALKDAALARVRTQVGYKTAWYASTMIQAPRMFPSSKQCSACGRRKPSLTGRPHLPVRQHRGRMRPADRS